MLSLGSAIRRLRESRGLSQKDLAERLQVNRTYISHLEADRRDPSFSFVRALALEVKAPAGLLLSIFLLDALPKRKREALQPLLTRLLDIADE